MNSQISYLQPQTRCQILADGGLLIFKSPYDGDLVSSLKSEIPGSARKWNRDQKAWLVDPRFGKVLQNLARRFYNEDLALPDVGKPVEKRELRLLELHYLGQCKDAGSGDRFAFGYLSNGEWGAIFPEEALRSWFEAGPAQPGSAQTLYGVLGVKASCNAEELRSAFRRAARTWHPDVNKDPDAAEQFKAINHAYQVLSDLKMRTRYDAGLKLEDSLHGKQNSPGLAAATFRSPLNCGFVMVEGIERLGRFVVEQILGWEDITRNGFTLCVSWPAGAKKPAEKWV